MGQDDKTGDIQCVANAIPVGNRNPCSQWQTRQYVKMIWKRMTSSSTEI